MEQTSLDGILNDKPEKPKKEPEQKAEAPAAAPAEPAAPAEKAETPAVERPTSRRAEHRKRELEAQGRDPATGQFVPKEGEAKPEAKAETKPEEKKAEAAAPPKEELTPKERAAFAKAADETRKRQMLEQELNRLRQAQQPAPAAGQPKTFWDDPEGALKSHQQQIQNIAVQTRLQTAETVARSRYTDFDEKVDKFAELAKTVPGLAAQWLGSHDPAEFAYRVGKNHIELQQAGSIDNLRADIEKKVRAEERAKVEAEFKEKADAAEKQRAALTPSLSRVTGTGRPAAQTFMGPTPLDDILKH